jgi:hypothetical protein
MYPSQQTFPDPIIRGPFLGHVGEQLLDVASPCSRAIVAKGQKVEFRYEDLSGLGCTQSICKQTVTFPVS